MASRPFKIVSFDIGRDPIMSQGKFIVAESRNSLDIYGSTVAQASKHKILAAKHKLSDSVIVGGARYFIYGEELSLLEASEQYGGVPAAAGEKIAQALIDHLNGTGLKLRVSDVKDLSLVFKVDDNAARWKELGFPVLS